MRQKFDASLIPGVTAGCRMSKSADGKGDEV